MLNEDLSVVSVLSVVHNHIVVDLIFRLGRLSLARQL